jgi:hypothetical protein
MASTRPLVSRVTPGQSKRLTVSGTPIHVWGFTNDRSFECLGGCHARTQAPIGRVWPAGGKGPGVHGVFRVSRDTVFDIRRVCVGFSGRAESRPDADSAGSSGQSRRDPHSGESARGIPVVRWGPRAQALITLQQVRRRAGALAGSSHLARRHRRQIIRIRPAHARQGAGSDAGTRTE